MKKQLVIGTRASRLAAWQTERVVELLTGAWPELVCETRPFETRGDKSLDKPLPEIGGKGLFTQELEEGLRNGEIDAAVHSLKDLPVEDAPDLTVGAIVERADAGDCLVARNGWTLATLPVGAVVGTSSVRRRAQLLAARPDLNIRDIRGNVETRIRKVTEGEYDATVLARAGVERLGLGEHVTESIGFDVMLPAPGQGALAVQCRRDDRETLEMLGAVDSLEIRAAVTAEREFLEELGGGCSAPIGTFATTDRPVPPWKITLEALVVSPDGDRVIRVRKSGIDPAAVGRAAARAALGQGAAGILESAGVVRRMPLKGKRVVVTRARKQCGPFCQGLEDLGAKPIVVPTIQISPVEDERRIDHVLDELTRYEWVVFSSVNGVDVFWRFLEARKLDAFVFAGVKTAAVGSATATALTGRGVVPDYVPEVFVGKEIAKGLVGVSGKRVCLLRAEEAGRELVDILQSRGAEVEDVGIYRTTPVDIEPWAAEELERGVDIVTVTSRSTVRAFASGVKSHPELASMLPGLPFACIGPVTADAARELGLYVAVVAKVHTTDGLLDALVEHFEEERGK